MKRRDLLFKYLPASIVGFFPKLPNFPEQEKQTIQENKNVQSRILISNEKKGSLTCFIKDHLEAMTMTIPPGTEEITFKVLHNNGFFTKHGTNTVVRYDWVLPEIKKK